MSEEGLRRFRGGLVFKAHRLVYHTSDEGVRPAPARQHRDLVGPSWKGRDHLILASDCIGFGFILVLDFFGFGFFGFGFGFSIATLWDPAGKVVIT